MRKFALILSVLCLPVLAAAAPLSGTRPNIVVMITDDQGYGPVGRHGHPWIKTPNLDRMYDASARFDRFLVSPTCSPTRAAMMSGRHPMKNGVTHTILERERMALSTVTLPQVLKQAGYTTGIFGKWHLGDEEPYQPHRRGFDEAFIHGAGGIGQAYKCSCADAPGNKYFDPVIRHNGSFVKTKGYCTDLFFTAALGWIKQVKGADAPFFAYITTNAPHGPFIAPPKNTKRFTDLGFQAKTAGFYGMIENIDENFGRLLDKAEAWGLLENTVIIFMSDNGMTGGGSGRGVVGKTADGKGLTAYNAGMRGQKGSPDEGGVRVPFFRALGWQDQTGQRHRPHRRAHRPDADAGRSRWRQTPGGPGRRAQPATADRGPESRLGGPFPVHPTPAAGRPGRIRTSRSGQSLPCAISGSAWSARRISTTWRRIRARRPTCSTNIPTW